jgi:predicted solute-binding protein
MENREAMIAKSTLYNKLHADKVVKYQRKYWKENKEEILKKQCERYARQHAIKKTNLIHV